MWSLVLLTNLLGSYSNELLLQITKGKLTYHQQCQFKKATSKMNADTEPNIRSGRMSLLELDLQGVLLTRLVAHLHSL